MFRYIVLLICTVLSLPVEAFEFMKNNIASVYEKINPAIVSVDTQLKDGFSSGTGCIINSNGTILTSAHILEDGKDVIVTTSNGEDYKAKVLIKFGDKKDIALI